MLATSTSPGTKKKGRTNKTADERNGYPKGWSEFAVSLKNEAGWKCERCSAPHDVSSNHCLTVHHLTGDKQQPFTDRWAFAVLCQSCHLKIQGRVKMDQLFFLEILPVSGWFKPHYAGYLASKAPKEPEPRKLEKPILLKQWLAEEAQRIGLTSHGVYMRLTKGHYPTVQIRRETARTIWVVGI